MIAVFGNYGVRNIGDDLILKGLLNQVQDEIRVFCGSPKQVEDQFSVQASQFFPGGFRSLWKYCSSSQYRKKVRKTFQELSSSDKILIGGGGLLVDRRFKAVFLWWCQLRVIAKTGKPYEFIANSIELRHCWSRWIFFPYLKKAQHISVRDEYSLQMLRKIGIKADKVKDLSWSLPLPMRYKEAPNSKIICLALCRWGINEERKDVFKQFLRERKSDGYKILALAFQSYCDDDRDLYRSIGISKEVITDFEGILTALRSCQILIGMRYHSVLLAIRMKIPFVAIAYQDKISHLLHDEDMEDSCQTVHDLDAQNLQVHFRNALGLIERRRV